jgi:hypothetical protein
MNKTIKLNNIPYGKKNPDNQKVGGLSFCSHHLIIPTLVIRSLNHELSGFRDA